MNDERLKKIAEDIGRNFEKLSSIQKQTDEVAESLLHNTLDILRLYHGIDASECCGRCKGGKHDAT